MLLLHLLLRVCGPPATNTAERALVITDDSLLHFPFYSEVSHLEASGCFGQSLYPQDAIVNTKLLSLSAISVWVQSFEARFGDLLVCSAP